MLYCVFISRFMPLYNISFTFYLPLFTQAHCLMEAWSRSRLLRGSMKLLYFVQKNLTQILQEEVWIRERYLEIYFFYIQKERII